MDKPPTKAKRNAEPDDTPEPHKVQAAPVVAIAGVPVRIPRWKKNGSLVWQQLKGRPSEGAQMVNVTRWAIGVCDGDPLDVAATVIAHLSEPLLAECKNANEDPVEVGQKIARRLPDDLQNAMIALREDSQDANMDIFQIVANAERVDRANMSLLDQPPWKKMKIPEKVLRDILRELSHPRPDNVTR
jgi:hypothetical protein